MSTAGTIKHWKLRDKDKKTFLTKGDIDPDCDDEVGAEIATFAHQELAHDARFRYEKAFNGYGIHVEVECVGFDDDNFEVEIE